MIGSTYRRCSCRDDVTGKQLGTACPRLKSARHGAWYFRVEGPPDAAGQRRTIRRGGFPSKAAAQEALDELRQRMGAGIDVVTKTSTGDWLAWWLEEKTKTASASAAGKKVRATTARSYEGHVRLYLLPHLGHIPLDKLAPRHIAAMFDAIESENAERRRPVSPATIRRIHATLRSALAVAHKQQRISVNPALHVDLPDVPRPKVRPWSAEELGKFLDAASADRLAALYELLAFTGLRRGEAVGLRWQDVNLVRGEITVVQQVVQLGYRTEIARPKTASGEHRRLELGSRTVGALLLHQLRQEAERLEWGEAYVESGLVFTREDGSQLHPEYVTRHMQRIADKAGLPRKRLHDLRHGMASLHLAAGVPLELVSKLVGHSSLALTADTYSHLLSGVGRQAAEAIEGLVPRASRTEEPTSGSHDPEDDSARSLTEENAQVRTGAPPGT